MMKLATFASIAWASKGRTTHRERFLARMDALMPRAKLLALIEPHDPKAGNGRPPLPMEPMPRIYCRQLWFNLSDPQAEDKDLLLKSGTIVDATIIAAPSSTKPAGAKFTGSSVDTREFATGAWPGTPRDCSRSPRRRTCISHDEDQNQRGSPTADRM